MKNPTPPILFLLLALLLSGLLALAACSSDDESPGTPAIPPPDQRRILLSEEIPPLVQDLETIAGLVSAGLPGGEAGVTPVYDEATGRWSWTRAEGETDSLMLGRWARTLDVVVGYFSGGTPVRERAGADRVEVIVGLEYLFEDFDPDTRAKTYAGRTMTLDLDLADDALAPDSIRLAGSGSGLIEGGISTTGTNWGSGFRNQVEAACDLEFSEVFCAKGQLRLDSDGIRLFTVTADSLAVQASWRYLSGATTGTIPWGCSPPVDSE